MNDLDKCTLARFKQLGDSASFHFADDSCKEWPQARNEEAKALALFRGNPHLQGVMREIAKGFLWSLPKGGGKQ